MAKGSAEPMPGRCGAKLRLTNPPRYCMQWPSQDSHSGRCRLHGADSLRGAAHPQARHLRYSAYMPRGLAEAAQAALNDPELLSLRTNIAVTDARLAEVWQGVAAGGRLAVLDEIGEAVHQLDRARQQGNENQQAEALAALLRAARAAGDTQRALGEISKLTEERRRLVETETRRIVAGRDTLTIEAAYGLVSMLVDIVLRHVSDRAQRQSILREVQPLLAEGGKT